jgi:CRP-like cAMP-binding protein
MATLNKPMSYPSFQDITDSLVEFSPKLRKALEHVETPRQYTSGEVILKVSTIPEGVNILHKGEVTISIEMGSKGRKNTRIVSAGEIIGLASVLSGLPSIATAQCKTDCETGYIPTKTLMDILRKNPDLCLELSNKLSAGEICATLKVKSMK